MPERVEIYGASDDLIEVEGTVPGCDEYPCAEAVFVLIGPAGQARVGVRYGSNGCWAIEVGPLGEDVPMLACAIEGRGYSARAVFDGVTTVVKTDG